MTMGWDPSLLGVFSPSGRFLLSLFADGVVVRELDCSWSSRKGTASPSLPREQQKARERQELWQGLEELRLRRLQGTQGAKEAPLQRLTPQVTGGGQS